MEKVTHRIPHDAPSKVEGMAIALYDSDDCRFSTLIDKIWLRKDSESPLSFYVHFLRHLQNLLSSDVHIGRDNRKDDGARVSHVSSHPSSFGVSMPFPRRKLSHETGWKTTVLPKICLATRITACMRKTSPRKVDSHVADHGHISFCGHSRCRFLEYSGDIYHA